MQIVQFIMALIVVHIFGDDIIVYNSRDLFGTDYNRIHCRNNYYEKKIRDSDDYFSIEDYEVFQIVKS